MLKAIQPLLDSGIITESTHQAINEAWEEKLTEAREQVRAELREEFSNRYEHDKKLMVEAIDKMVTESLSAEIEEFQAEKQSFANDRARFNARMVESANKFNDFMVTKLAEEIKELRADRKQYENSVAKLESFVVKSLSEEIQEFEQDKRAVVETKVKLVAEAKDKLAELQQNFVARSAELVKESVTKHLQSELTQLKEDIQIARENMFGRRLFEAFAGEFAVTHLNENKEIAKLTQQLKSAERQLDEAKQEITTKQKLVESKANEVKMIKEASERREMINNLLKPLNKEKASVMSELLESVQTDKLQSAFDKYLPAVLDNKSVGKQKSSVLTEGRTEVTGNKSAKSDELSNVVELKRLAGLN